MGPLGNRESNLKKDLFSNLASTQSRTNSPMTGLEEGHLAHSGETYRRAACDLNLGERRVFRPVLLLQ